MRMNLIFLTFLGLLIASCGREYGDERAPASVGGTLPQARLLTANEKLKATNICYAFRSKKSKFLLDHMGANFRFQVEERKCDRAAIDKTLNTTLTRVLNSDPLVFDVDDIDFFFKEVQTHDYGFMLPVCEALVANNNISNTFDTGLGEKLALSFKEESDGDWIVIETARSALDEEGEQFYEVYQKDSARVELKSDAPAPQFGMLLEIERVRLCEGEYEGRKYLYRRRYLP